MEFKENFLTALRKVEEEWNRMPHIFCTKELAAQLEGTIPG